MTETAQAVQEEQSPQPQKLEQPTSIKIVQLVILVIVLIIETWAIAVGGSFGAPYCINGLGDLLLPGTFFDRLQRIIFFGLVLGLIAAGLAKISKLFIIKGTYSSQKFFDTNRFVDNTFLKAVLIAVIGNILITALLLMTVFKGC